MSIGDVTVTLSRLALAKAIKTPDSNEENAEPWTKSIIFHQSHIDEHMKQQLFGSTYTKNNNRRMKGRPLSAQMLSNNQQQKYPLQDKKRYSAHIQSSKLTNLPNKINTPPNKIPLSQQRVSNSNISLPLGKLAQANSVNKSKHLLLPSDDEEEDSESEEENTDDDDDSDDDNKIELKNITINRTKPVSPIPNTSTQLEKGKHKLYTIESSDTESEEEEEDIDSDSEEEDIKPQNKPHAKRMSTLRQLEQGTSINKNVKAVSDTMTAPTTGFLPPIQTSTPESTEEWYAAIMKSEDQSASTPVSNDSYNLFSDNGTHTSSNPQHSPKSSSPKSSSPKSSSPKSNYIPLKQNNHSNSSLMNQPSSLLMNQTLPQPSSLLMNQSLPQPSSLLMNQSLPQPSLFIHQNMSQPTLMMNHPQPLLMNQSNNNINQNRRSTMTEMDILYLQQQQQALHQMQLQQAMQYQHAQQMMQIQQYQQALQMQQYQQQQIKSKQENRKSISGMDLMIQMEKEKAARKVVNKKKIPNPSKVKLSNGLVGTVPEQGLHNINFQEYVLKKNKQQKSTKDNSMMDAQFYPLQNPSSLSLMYPSNNNRRSQLIDQSQLPIPQMSMSTPVNQPYFSNTAKNNRNSQYLPTQNGITSKRHSTYSNLSQYL